MNVERLKQGELAKLIGKPAVWLRDNPDKVPRNQDGSYSLRAAVKALATNYEPADLPAAVAERALQVAEGLAWDAAEPAAWAATLADLDRDHGPAGLARFALLLLDHLQVRAASDTSATDTPELIEARHHAEARSRSAAEIERLEHREARLAGRCVVACARCQKFRWFDDWRPLNKLPAGYVAEKATTCPNCEDQP